MTPMMNVAYTTAVLLQRIIKCLKFVLGVEIQEGGFLRRRVNGVTFDTF